MSWKMMPLWMCLAFPAAAFAQSASTERPPEAARRGPPVMKSSLAVVLEHRTELALSTEQVAWLEQREQQLQQENAPLKQKLEELRPPRGGEGRRPPPGEGMGPPMGGRMGGTGSESAPDRVAMEERMTQARSAMDGMRDNDTRAYNEAETVMTEAQKTQARALITQEREAMRQRHEAMRQQRGR
ncbi:hypothetical protein BO221_44985 [Archangium sp. Cb G35]|uniref:hypothetical protein n=1 Tax=Archangium sp. Cb G35 TaxID=1920190 RepID=UPI000937D77D|nr:hypothetical protein [Archangium sp. Cb G35]OJT17713.1 hypothetical protein BO221_44985 [Archangium sp. Cb G35]